MRKYIQINIRVAFGASPKKASVKPVMERLEAEALIKLPKLCCIWYLHFSIFVHASAM